MLTTIGKSVLSRLPAKLRRLFHLEALSDSSTDGPSLRSFDESTNVASTPPPDEAIDLHCIWGIEFYTPSHTEALERGLQQLGWSAENTQARLGDDPIGWLRDLRRYRHGGGALSLGIFQKEGTPAAFFDARQVASLPSSIKYAQAHISSVAPSLIALTVCFTLQESYGDQINDLLRKPRTSYKVPRRNGYTIRDPYYQKQRAMDEIRQSIQQDISEWFADNLPGVFSGMEGGVLPTCELLSANIATPWPPEEQAQKQLPIWSYFGIIGFLLGFGYWEHQKIAGLYFTIDDSGYHARLLGNISALGLVGWSEEDHDRDTLIYALNEEIRHVGPTWAMLPLVEQYTKAVTSGTITDEPKPAKALDYLSQSLLTRVDIATIALELKDICERTGWPWGDADAFERVRRNEEQTLGEHLRLMVGAQATWLREADRVVRDNTSQYGNLLASAENIRLQRRIGWLTWALTGLAVVAVAMPVVAEKCL